MLEMVYTKHVELTADAALHFVADGFFENLRLWESAVTTERFDAGPVGVATGHQIVCHVAPSRCLVPHPANSGELPTADPAFPLSVAPSQVTMGNPRIGGAREPVVPIDSDAAGRSRRNPSWDQPSSDRTCRRGCGACVALRHRLRTLLGDARQMMRTQEQCH